ncbi:metallophosphoesterase [bacterium]|nr:metallophosphoesterase [bacterium]
MASLPHHSCYDIIGDVHGHALRLRELLGKLGYERAGRGFRHGDSDRKAVFVGDFIDRGPEIRETLEIVRAMMEDGNAYAVMGNHEFNAIAYATVHEGRYLRSHSPRNESQVRQTLDQLGAPTVPDHWVDWFRILPLHLANEHLRVVHACWDPWAIRVADAALEDHGGVTDGFMAAALASPGRDEDLFQAVEWLLKGKEALLPRGSGPALDKDGHPRRAIRVRWFGVPEDPTYSGMLFPRGAMAGIPAEPLADLAKLRLDDSGYPPADPPVFFGHYWLKGKPEIQAPNVVCLDYSVAGDGCLAAYTHRPGESLADAHFTTSCHGPRPSQGRSPGIFRS